MFQAGYIQNPSLAAADPIARLTIWQTCAMLGSQKPSLFALFAADDVALPLYEGLADVFDADRFKSLHCVLQIMWHCYIIRPLQTIPCQVLKSLSCLLHIMLLCCYIRAW